MDIVPSWGGSMFEALMVPLLVPEARWGPRSWGVTTRCTSAPRSSTASRRPATATGASRPPTTPPAATEYGVDAIGLNPDGYASNNVNTLVDYGFGDCRPAQPLPPPEAYTDGVDPARLVPGPAVRPPGRPRQPGQAVSPDAYGEGGFYDAVNVDSGQVSRYRLAPTRAWSWPPSATSSPATACSATSPGARSSWAVRPLLAMEEFTAGG